MFLKKKGWEVFVLVNLALLGVFIYYTGWVWATRSGEGALLGSYGDPIILGLMAYPIMFAALVLNVVWAIVLVVRVRTKELNGVSHIVAFAVVVISWSTAVYHEHSRAYTGCDVHPSAPACQVPHNHQQ